MFISNEVQAACKKAQIVRLAAKGTPEYPALYAAQPEQVRKAAEQQKERAVRREVKQALEAAGIRTANEAVATFGSVDLTEVDLIEGEE